jgi:hypothetical protein
MNSGRMQICCARPSSNGYVLTYPAANAKDQVKKVLRALGISGDTIEKSLAMLADFGPDEMLLVEQCEIPEQVLQSNGFMVV